MIEERTHFSVLRSYYTSIMKLPENMQLEAFIMLMEYGLNGVEPETDNFIIECLFEMMKPNIDAGIRRAEASRKNGQKGGRPPKDKNLEKPSETNNILEKSDETKKKAEMDKDNGKKEIDMEMDDDMESEKEDSKGEKRTFFYIDYFNDKCHWMPKISMNNTSSLVSDLWFAGHYDEDIKKVIDKVCEIEILQPECSDYVNCQKAEWIFKLENFEKILNGEYDKYY